MSQTQVYESEDEEMSSTQLPSYAPEQIATPKREQAKRLKSKGEPITKPGSPAGLPLSMIRSTQSTRRLAFGQARKRRTHKKKMDSRRKKTRRSHKK